MKAIVAELGKENKSSAEEQDEATIQKGEQNQQKQNRLFSSLGRLDAVDGRGYHSKLPHRHKQIQIIHHCGASTPQSETPEDTHSQEEQKAGDDSDQRMEGHERGRRRERLLRARLQKDEEKVFANVQDIKSIKPLSPRR
eukprot:scaffold98941_cov58-Cyclotella_meneghiniana.AAC.1